MADRAREIEDELRAAGVKAVLATSEVARLLGRTERTVYQYEAIGRLRSCGGGRVRKCFTRYAVARLLAGR